ncbi:MAG: hypothetical protein F2729_04540 [Actinobacteria bacterium]|uniref:Unannotated protein n=1 Tax=freshwater metagenome TaxID=449393 RepID=A0A6J6WYW7_9ZZZZ|nr:hypothetical protein [Actinomycetota bacterium]
MTQIDPWVSDELSPVMPRLSIVLVVAVLVGASAPALVIIATWLFGGYPKEASIALIYCSTPHLVAYLACKKPSAFIGRVAFLRYMLWATCLTIVLVTPLSTILFLL